MRSFPFSFQDDQNEFFTQRSASDRGSEYNIKNVFGHRSVTKDASKSYNYIVELYGFTTEGLACLLAMKLKKMIHMSDKPSDLPQGGDMQSYLVTLSMELVDFCWHQTPMSDIAGVINEEEIEDEDDDDYEEDDAYPFCFCKLCKLFFLSLQWISFIIYFTAFRV